MNTPPDNNDQTADVFDRAWILLEREGRCDARGGAEYRRIRRSWDRVVGVLHAVDLITHRANRPAKPTGGKDGAL